jgi:hypothetical protein
LRVCRRSHAARFANLGGARRIEWNVNIPDGRHVLVWAQSNRPMARE